jgi:uncharacterized membrane protein YeaQ/YmgE (transglycosylase-associated protein family)
VTDVFLFVALGLVAGVAARLGMLGPEPGGWRASILIGVFGAFAGGVLARPLGMYDNGCPAGWLMSAFGAVALLLGHHALRGVEPREPSTRPAVFGGRRRSR